MSAVQDRPERAPERARTVEVHHLGDQRHRRDFTGMAAGFGALRDDQVDPGGGAPQRVLSGRGQGNHQDVVGEGLVEQRLHRDTAWFTRHYLVAPSSSVAGRSVAERVESMRFVRVLRRVWIPLVLLVVMFTRHGPSRRRFGDIQDNVLYWNFVVATWIPIYFIIYIVPRL